MIFNPRDQKYKTPYGAVPCGTDITLTLRPSVEERFTSCILVLYEEFSDTRHEIPLSPAGEEDGCALFTCTYAAPEAPDLLWLCFRFQRDSGETVWLGKNGFCGEGQSVCWQQTVYDASTSHPDWFGRGVTYQIFPDRFCRLSIPDPTGMLGDRVVHQNWRELMEYLPDAQGEIRNRDFYGGSLRGIESKLDYLQRLGVTTIYLNPIFESESNHRYNTGNYKKIDPMLGTEDDLRSLCAKAKELGMHVMLDGVFNHTADNSLYFNAKGAYPTLGAAQSKDSPYYPWYDFQDWPKRYSSWWGITTMPAVNEWHPDYIDYIIEGQDSVIRRWLRCGADAWRLDVADELPDSFIASIRRVMLEEKPDSFLLGEVWEDGSNKIAYSQRRKYLLGHETDGLMNYPFRVSALDYLRGGDAANFKEAMETIRENYPPFAFYSGMNMLGTHDNPRVLTMLGTDPQAVPPTRTERANYRMTSAEYYRGSRLLQTGAILLYAFPGSPTVYYGDEVGMEGFEDPFNRGTFPWGEEDSTIQKRFIRLGKLRNTRRSLQQGTLRWLYAQGHGLAFARDYEGETTVAAINVGDGALSLTLPWPGALATDALTGQQFLPLHGWVTLSLPPMDGVLLI